MVKKRNVFGLVVFLLFLLLGSVLVFAIPSFYPSSVGKQINVSEDNLASYFYNFSQDVNNSEAESLVFDILSISSSNSLHNGFSLTNFYWIYWNDSLSKENSSSGLVSFFADNDNETGLFNLSVFVGNSPNKQGESRSFFFEVNATNDVPLFVDLSNVSNSYNFSANSSESYWFNITFQGEDEESHYPLNLSNISFLSCSKANWTNSSNCLLDYSLINVDNTTLRINLTNVTRENVGQYNLSVCINDNINSTTSYPLYRSSDYNENKSSCQNTSFNVFYLLSINASNCSETSFSESENLVCYINITTRLPIQNFSLNSTAYLNFSSSPSYISQLPGLDWFYSYKQNSSSGFFKQIPINVSLSKRNVGNWTINLKLNDSDGTIELQNITLFINRTASSPSLSFNFSGRDNITSIGASTIFYFNISDNDFLIPDKRFYNETVNLTIVISNSSNLSQRVSWQNFSNKTFNYEEDGTNLSTSFISFTPNSSQAGNWTINLSYSDIDGLGSYTLFNFTILNNQYPYWNAATFYLNCTVNSTRDTTRNCLYLNLTNASNGIIWANDSAGDSLNFSIIGISGTNYPSNFNLTTAGIVNFTPWKQDVTLYSGPWDFNLSVSDGYLANTSLRVIVNVSNVNSPPFIANLSYPASTNENNFTSISFNIYDYDLLVPLGDSPATEGNFSLVKTVVNLSGEALSVSSFSDSTNFVGFYQYNFSFTPSKSNVGNHSFNISVSDRNLASNWTTFNISVVEINNVPVFVGGITNYSSAVGRELYLNFNASDFEDGEDSDGNLFFNYTFLNGSNIFNEAIFNSTNGVVNLTLNESHAGRYRINLTVTDQGLGGSNNKTNSTIFWLFIYDSPNITSPFEGASFSLVENQTFVFNFSANHSVGNNLVYEVWTDNLNCSLANSSDCVYSQLALRNSFGGLGNSTNFSWSFLPNFSEESYGLEKNLTLLAYINDSSLADANLLNDSISVKLNITGTNYPLGRTETNFSDQSVSNTQTIQLDLRNYFYDYDSLDSFYSQTINFSLQSSASTRLIQHTFSDWSLTLSLLSNVLSTTEILNVSAYEINSTNNQTIRNVTSNNFIVNFYEPTETSVSTPSSGGGSSTQTKHVSLLIGVPSSVEVGFGDQITVPISIKNNGDLSVSGISLAGLVRLEDQDSEEVSLALSKNSISSLAVDASENLSAVVYANTKRAGRYLGVIYASVASPSFSQEGNFYIEIEVVPSKTVEEVLVFTEKLVVENPECIELRDRLEEAKKLREEGRFEEAMEISNEVVDACRKSISQTRRFGFLQYDVSNVLVYLFSGLILVFVLAFLFYVYKRIKFNKSGEDDYI